MFLSDAVMRSLCSSSKIFSHGNTSCMAPEIESGDGDDDGDYGDGKEAKSTLRAATSTVLSYFVICLRHLLRMQGQ